MTPPFERTTCACRTCVSCCKSQPGALAPSDFERIAEQLGETPEQAERHFWASPGAVAMNTATGELYRIGTITPRLRQGACVFLKHNRCTIHTVAPLGCSHFDTHLDAEEGQRRGLWLLRQIDGNAEYTELRNRLPPATSWRPRSY